MHAFHSKLLKNPPAFEPIQLSVIVFFKGNVYFYDNLGFYTQNRANSNKIELILSTTIKELKGHL